MSKIISQYPHFPFNILWYSRHQISEHGLIYFRHLLPKRIIYISCKVSDGDRHLWKEIWNQVHQEIPQAAVSPWCL